MSICLFLPPLCLIKQYLAPNIGTIKTIQLARDQKTSMELEWPEWDLMIGNAMKIEKSVYDKK